MKSKALKTKVQNGPGSTKAGREILVGLKEVLHSLQTGDLSRLTIREVEIPEPSDYKPADVKSLRRELGVSQKVFACLLGVSSGLVAHWEYGVRKPAPLAARLMDRIKDDPADFVQKLMIRRDMSHP